jgi:hypothetical protein
VPKVYVVAVRVDTFFKVVDIAAARRLLGHCHVDRLSQRNLLGGATGGLPATCAVVRLEHPSGMLRVIRFRGHLPKGGYDVPNGQRDEEPAAAPAV